VNTSVVVYLHISSGQLVPVCARSLLLWLSPELQSRSLSSEHNCRFWVQKTL